jgi:large subunit ribosomal protein L15
MKLHTLSPNAGSTKSRKRIARGQGSGFGGTSTRGHNGAKSRSGYSKKIGFEGGQMPLQRRVPKFGFKPLNKTIFKAINLETLQYVIESKNLTKIEVADFINSGLASKSDSIKLLGGGVITSKVEVSVHAASKSAIEAVEKLGGKVILL